MIGVEPDQALAAAVHRLPSNSHAAVLRSLASLCSELTRCRGLEQTMSVLLAGIGRLLPLRSAHASVYQDHRLLLGLDASWSRRRLQLQLRCRADASGCMPPGVPARRRRPWLGKDGRVHLPLRNHPGAGGLLSLAPRRPVTDEQLAVLAWLAEPATATLQRVLREYDQQAVLARLWSDARYRRLVEACAEMIWCVDSKSRYTFVNPAVEAVMGYRPDDVVGRCSSEFQTAEQYRRDKETFAHVLAGRQIGYESTYLRKDGKPVVLRINASPLHDERGQVIGAIGTAADVTDYKDAEEVLRQRERQLRLVLRQLPAIVWTTDAPLTVRSVVGAAQHLFGIPAEQVVGKTVREVFGPGDALVHMCGRALAGDSSSREGSRGDCILQSMIEPLRDDRGEIGGTLGITLDVTELRRSQQALLHERERAQVTLDSIGDGVVTTDVHGRVTYMNSAAQSICGWSSEDASGQPLDKIFQLIDKETGRVVPSPADEVLRRGQAVVPPLVSYLRRRGGALVAVEDRTAPIRDHAGRVLGAVLVFHDVSATQAMAEQLVHQATHDALTGLPNRALLLDRLGQSLIQAARHGGRVALMFIDVDRFKQINDTLGHAVGDQLLKQIARRLQDCVRRSDTVSRHGGDEFILLLSEAGEPMELGDVAEKIVARLAEPYWVNDHELHLSGSIGISVFPDDGADAETLIKHADIAMYHAKQSGRNTFQFFIDDMNRKATERLFLEHGLRRALARNQLVLRYQPQINLGSGRIVGAEALLRWRHPKRGLIPPAEFVPIAEDSGIILAIGRWVLEEASRQARSWHQLGLPPLRVAVNLSTVELRQKGIVQAVERVLADVGLSPERLELELTESVVMSEVAGAAKRLRELKELGLRLAIDDFGTGYSSLSYLKRLPVDSLKIDRAFIRDVSANRDEAAIADAIIRVGHSLRLTIVAEGVEDRAALDFLRDRQCDDVQGYYFSGPVGPEQFAELVRRRGPEHCWPL